jgi:site-specific DNA-methyltransferase (adenine-specific)
MRAVLNATRGEYLRREYEDLRREYEDLRREYEDLRREYEDLRRPFYADPDGTDTWIFPTVSSYPGKHPCEKPLAMMEHIVKTSSRPDATVLDCFAGSGSTLLAAKNLGRKAIGVEMDERYCEITANRLSNLTLALER